MPFPSFIDFFAQGGRIRKESQRNGHNVPLFGGDPSETETMRYVFLQILFLAVSFEKIPFVGQYEKRIVFDYLIHLFDERGFEG